MISKLQKTFENNQENDNSYENQQFEVVPGESYASKVDKLFVIDYKKSTYENIQFSANQMRNMMKQVSKVLDQKIYKYYGLMGQKSIPQTDDLNILVEKLQTELNANHKLIKTQLTQIKQIELLQKQMASSKRIQKQAQRLKQYFQTKKLMIQSDKQTRFSKGQINKAGQYLARDLDFQRHYFRFNQIKENFQYAMLRDQEQTRKNNQLQIKLKELEQRHDRMNNLYNEKIKIAQINQIQIEENKSFCKEWQLKKDLFRKKQQTKKKNEVYSYNNKNLISKLQNQVQYLRKQSNQESQRISSFEKRIEFIQKEINSFEHSSDLSRKIEQSISLKNIEILLKSKRQKILSTSYFNEQQVSKSLDKKFNLNLTQSSILLKPNFKIKQLQKLSKSKISSHFAVNKSMDFGKYSKINDLNHIYQKMPQTKLSSFQKKIVKWQPIHRKRITQLSKPPIVQGQHKEQLENPQNQGK